MKLRSTGSLVLVALLGCSGSGTSDHAPPFFLRPRWANQQRVPTASHLRAVRFNTPVQGFIAGESSSIYRTDDGGVSWVQEEHAPFKRGGDIAGLDFFGSEVHAVGAADDNGQARHWLSTDAANWTTADADGAGIKFVSVDVTPSITGGADYLTWALREDWTINVSKVGIAPGEQTNIPTPGGGAKAIAIDMLGSGPGYVTGEAGNFFVTDDWGATWGLVPGRGANTLRDVHATAADTVFACGDNGTLLWTEDGIDVPNAIGVAALPGGPGAGTFRGVHFFHTKQDESLGWVVGDGGTIYRISGTYDSMTMMWTWTWLLLASVTGEDLYDVHFADPTTGYAVGDNGTVVKLVDSGTATTPTLLTAGRTETINAVSFDPTGTRGVAVGDNGWIYKTLNGGSFWSAVQIGSTRWTGASVPPGNFNVAYICGEGGAVRRNLDLAGGDTWFAASGLGATNFRAIHFPSSADVGFVVGDGQALLYTNTGTGAFTWTAPGTAAAVTTDFQSLSSSIAGGGFDLFAAGTNGVVVTQTLGLYASPWTVAAANGSFGGGTIQAIQSPTSAIVFAAVDFGGTRLQRRLVGLWGGATQPAGPPPTAAGLAFAGQSFGWWVSDKIYTTENGGGLPNDWTVRLAHTKETFKGVWMSQSGTVGYVVGTGGTILRTGTGGK